MISPFINKSQPSISPAGSYLHSTSFSSPLSLQSMASTFNLAAAPLLILLFTAFSSLPLHALNIGLNAHAGLDLVTLITFFDHLLLIISDSYRIIFSLLFFVCSSNSAAEHVNLCSVKVRTYDRSISSVFYFFLICG